MQGLISPTRGQKLGCCSHVRVSLLKMAWTGLSGHVSVNISWKGHETGVLWPYKGLPEKGVLSHASLLHTSCLSPSSPLSESHGGEVGFLDSESRWGSRSREGAPVRGPGLCPPLFHLPHTPQWSWWKDDDHTSSCCCCLICSKHSQNSQVVKKTCQFYYYWLLLLLIVNCEVQSYQTITA